MRSSTRAHLTEAARTTGVRDAPVPEALRSAPHAGSVPAGLVAEAYYGKRGFAP